MERSSSVSPNRRGPALVALCMAAFVISLDTTIVNVALPSLVRQLDASVTDLQWVVDAYSLVFAALILAAGSLSDRLGRKGILMAGLGLFGAASLAGSAGSSVGQLVAARAVMGLGAALIFPATLSIISNIFTRRAERARAIGLWGATTGVGIALGPIMGSSRRPTLAGGPGAPSPGSRPVSRSWLGSWPSSGAVAIPCWTSACFGT